MATREQHSGLDSGKKSGRRSGILLKEEGTVSTADGLLEYICRLGMVHLNRSIYSRSVENAWNHTSGPVFPVLMQLIEKYEVFVCRALVPTRTTYATPDIAKSLVALACDREKGISEELQRFYETVRVEGPLTSTKAKEYLDISTRQSKAIRDDLIKRLLITVVGGEPSSSQNWPEYLYWTVNEWLANHDIDTSELRPTDEDRRAVLTAASKCMIRADTKELAKALRWPESQVKAHLACIED